MKHLSSCLILCSLALLGCGGGGGGGGDETAEVGGNVIDLVGTLIPNADITIRDRTTTTNAGGVYNVEGLPEGVWEIHAESQPNADGVVYSAKTAVQCFEGERSRNVNLTLVRLDQQATLYGVVRDRDGFIVQGAHVFAFIQSGGAQIASTMDITNAQGEYELKTLASGLAYTINGSARGYASDRDTVTLTAGERRQFDIVLGDAADPLLAAPGSLTAVAWTTPDMNLRGGGDAGAFEQIKRRYDPARARRASEPGGQLRTIGGNHIEVDLTWDPPSTNLQYLLGYGVYRATSAVGASQPVDFLRDPETYFFADLADELVEAQTYYYEMTSLNVNYPGTGNSESGFSNRVGVETLGDLELLPVTQGPLTFHWTNTSGADEFFVYLFDERPTINVFEIYRNGVAATGTSHVYGGPALQSGRRYYYMILGLANSNNSRTISRIGEFIAN